MHASFCYVWISLERNAYTAPYVINISFIIVVSKFISVIEMQELVIVKDLSYFGVRNVLQEKNPDTERFSREVLGIFVLLLISEINQISIKKNFRK